MLPQIANVAFEEAANGARLGYMVLGILIVMYISAIPFYMALYQAFKLLTYIDKNEAFSDLSVLSLKKIKNCAQAITGLYVVSLPLFFIFAERDDAPGVCFCRDGCLCCSDGNCRFCRCSPKAFTRSDQDKNRK